MGSHQRWAASDRPATILFQRCPLLLMQNLKRVDLRHQGRRSGHASMQRLCVHFQQLGYLLQAEHFVDPHGTGSRHDKSDEIYIHGSCL